MELTPAHWEEPLEDEAVFGNDHFRQRRMILTVGASYALCSVLGFTARADPTQRVLSIAYSGSVGLDPNVRNLGNNLNNRARLRAAVSVAMATGCG